jgi:hypothetical protein
VPVRLYLSNSTPPLTPTADTTGWEAVSPTAVTRALTLTKEGASASASGTFAPGAINTEMRLGRFVSPPLTRAVNFAGDSGDVTIAFARQRVSGGTAIVSFWRFWGVSGDGDTFLGTPFGSSEPGVNWTTTTGVTAGTALVANHTSPFNAAAGDRIVVDIGFRITDTTTSTGTLYYGGTAGTDLAGGDTGTTAETRPPWIEFSGLTLADFAADPVVVAATASAPLGALTATASGVRATGATASALLGRLTATASGVRSTAATASAPLGALTASASGVVTAEGITGTASAALGALTATASGTRSTAATASAPLGALTATAAGTATPPNAGTATAPLGALTATAAAVRTTAATAAATLGGLTATAAGTAFTGPNAQAFLGALTATAAATRTTSATATAPLGALTATASGTRTSTGATATANLGALTATAAQEIPADGPEPGRFFLAYS